MNLNFKSLHIFLCIVAYIVLYVKNKNKKAILIECITRAFEGLNLNDKIIEEFKEEIKSEVIG